MVAGTYSLALTAQSREGRSCLHRACSSCSPFRGHPSSVRLFPKLARPRPPSALSSPPPLALLPPQSSRPIPFSLGPAPFTLFFCTVCLWLIGASCLFLSFPFLSLSSSPVAAHPARVVVVGSLSLPVTTSAPRVFILLLLLLLLPPPPQSRAPPLSSVTARLPTTATPSRLPGLVPPPSIRLRFASTAAVRRSSRFPVDQASVPVQNRDQRVRTRRRSVSTAGLFRLPDAPLRW